MLQFVWGHVIQKRYYYPLRIFTHLNLCLADAIHNFKWVKIIPYSTHQYTGRCYYNIDHHKYYSSAVWIFISYTAVLVDTAMASQTKYRPVGRVEQATM